jgi:hypothetical protein
MTPAGRLSVGRRSFPPTGALHRRGTVPRLIPWDVWVAAAIAVAAWQRFSICHPQSSSSSILAYAPISPRKPLAMNSSDETGIERAHSWCTGYRHRRPGMEPARKGIFVADVIYSTDLGIPRAIVQAESDRRAGRVRNADACLILFPDCWGRPLWRVDPCEQSHRAEAAAGNADDRPTAPIQGPT